MWLHDSIHVTEGDTVRIERWHTKWRDRLSGHHLSGEDDSIPVPYWKIKEVPAPTVMVAAVRLWLGNVVLLALLAVAVYYGVKCYKVYKYRL